MKYRYREPHEMKDSGVDWLGVIPKEWGVNKLKHHFVIKSGGTPKSDISEFWDGDINWFTPVDLGNTKYLDKSARTISKKGMMNSSVSLIKAGSIIMSSRAPIGSLGISKGDFTTNQGCKSLETMDSMDVDFVYYYLLISKKALENNGSGTTFLELSGNSFSNFKVSFTNLQEQQKIANFLDKKTAEFDALVEKKESFIAKLEEAKKSMISEVVTGKKRVIEYRGQLSIEDRRADEMKYSGIEWLGVIPREWEIKRLKYILSERSLRSLTGIETPLSMSQKFGLIRTSEMTSIPNQSLNLIGNKICYPNDLVFNKLKAHLGVFSVAKEKGLVSPDYAVYYSESETTSIKYFEYLFKTVIYINEFKKYSSGVGEGLTRLYTTGLSGITSLYPNKKEQDLISDFITGKIEETNIVIEKIKIQIEKLKEAKQSLISEAVTGKIEVLD